MLKFDLRVKLGRVTSGAKIAVSAFKQSFASCIKHLQVKFICQIDHAKTIAAIMHPTTRIKSQYGRHNENISKLKNKSEIKHEL